MKTPKAILLGGVALGLFLTPMLLLDRTYAASRTIAIPTLPSSVEDRVRDLDGWARWGPLLGRVDGAPELSAEAVEARWPELGAGATSIRIVSLEATDGGAVLRYALEGGTALADHHGTITITEIEGANTSVRWEALGEVGPMPWSRFGGLMRGAVLEADVEDCLARLRGEFLGSPD